MNFSQRYNLKVAVELNNVGVHLLQAQDYRNAMKILKQSIDTMKLVIGTNHHDKIATTATDSSEIDASYANIMNARRLMFQAYENTMVVDESDYYVYMKNDGFQYERNVSMDTTTTPRTPTAVDACPILIEDVPYADSDSVLDVSDCVIESSILFYNLALVHIRTSGNLDLDANSKSNHRRQQQEQQQEQRKERYQEELLVEGGMFLFELSLNLLLEGEEDEEEVTEVVRGSRVFMVSLIFTEFIRLYQNRGETEEAENVMLRLCELIILNEVSSEENSEILTAPVAAAAA